MLYAAKSSREQLANWQPNNNKDNKKVVCNYAMHELATQCS